jgi:hypothetical protein
MSAIFSAIKSIKNEIRFDSKYHIVMTIAVLLKLVFVTCAILGMMDKIDNAQNAEQHKRIMMAKDMSNELTKIVVLGMMVVIFFPRNNTYCIDKSFKTLLFVFAIISLLEIHWYVFLGQIDLVNRIQYFTGRIGSFDQQVHNDQIHILHTR